MKIEGYSWVRKPATATIMITEAFFLVAGFELEGYDEFIGSRCVVRAEPQMQQEGWLGFINQILLEIGLALLRPKSLIHALTTNCRVHFKTRFINQSLSVLDFFKISISQN